MNFALRLLDGECSGGAVGQLWGVRPQDGSSQDPWAQPAAVSAFSWLAPVLGPPGKMAVPAGTPPCPCGADIGLWTVGL